jgi:hypothetical protein
MQYEKEKEYLDTLIKEFIDLIKKFDDFKKKSDMSKELEADKDRFEKDFVSLNCEIQQVRSDNETLLDEIKNREEHLKNLDREIHEKTSLIQLLETKISEMKGN